MHLYCRRTGSQARFRACEAQASDRHTQLNRQKMRTHFERPYPKVVSEAVYSLELQLPCNAPPPEQLALAMKWLPRRPPTSGLRAALVAGLYDKLCSHGNYTLRLHDKIAACPVSAPPHAYRNTDDRHRASSAQREKLLAPRTPLRAERRLEKPLYT